MHLVLSPRNQVDTPVPGSVSVIGTLRWSNSDPGWAGAWEMDGRHWGIKGVSFDEAYRDLVWGAMAIASGHALPGSPP